MTTTASPDGTPEPRSDDEGAPAEPTGQHLDADGDTPPPPADPAPSAPQPSANGGGRPDESFETLVSDVLGVDPEASRRKKLRWLFVKAAVGLLGILGAVLVAYLMIKPSTIRENDTNTGIDAAKTPFTVSVRPEEGEPPTWAMVLDRELTADETRKLTTGDPGSAFSYLRELGGRPLVYASVMEHAPERYERNTRDGGLELTDAFKMTVLSTRSSAVVIDGWKTTGITCHKSTTQTVVAMPPQGGATYQGIRLHLPPRAEEPVLTDDAEGQGESYFGTHYIEVGGGQPSGGLRVEAIAPRGQACEWGIKVHYNDSYQKGEWLQLKDAKGKPLRIRTESVPADLRQKWVFASVAWTPCHKNPEGSLCDLV
ncbi:hypothetical protein ACWHA6_17090 [Streptomyces anthocyanicus]|uniref:hypothetical protein n=1 Tax=Streptomyces anthocyanicus TaxID=68174 RepID=UPI003649F679